MQTFAGKVVLITGAGSGIGEAAARAFGREGAILVLADKEGERVVSLAGSLGVEEDQVLARRADVSKPEECEALVKAAVARFGRLDVLVNDAGVDQMGLIDQAELSDWEHVLRTDLYGVFYMCRYAMPHLREVKGCVVNVSSVSGLGGDWNHSYYNAAKGAVTNFTRALALDEAKHGVRVNAVNPSLVFTAMTEQMKSKPELIRKFKERIPLGRAAEPDDIAGPILFLASDAARFVNGVNLPVDGGLMASNGQPPLS
ncbi:MAG: SDR family oxidoreductase [Acidobacteriota bacterium]|nr:SDR family oxidoreductase [Acidobacteriota bacterium]